MKNVQTYKTKMKRPDLQSTQCDVIYHLFTMSKHQISFNRNNIKKKKNCIFQTIYSFDFSTQKNSKK